MKMNQAGEYRYDKYGRKKPKKTRSKTVKNMCLEIRRRFWAYERMRQYAKA